MKILFVIPYTPSLVRVRSYNFLKQLSARGHEITLVCLGAEQDQQTLETLRAFTDNIYTFSQPSWKSLLNCGLTLPGSQPLQAAYSWNPRMGALVVDLAARRNGNKGFDVVHVEHLRALRYALQVKRASSTAPVVWDSVDSITHLFSQAVKSHPKKVARWLLRLELARTRRAEAAGAVIFDRTVVTSIVDQRVFLEIQPEAKISLLPNGVDVDYFQPDESKPRVEDTIVISGKMSYHANVSMVIHLLEDIMPQVWAQKPEIKVWIAGQNPSAEILKFGHDRSITITGAVPDMRPYLQRAAIAVAPLRYGAGTQNKVLEAMACGTPVVATSKAVASLNITPGENILVANDPDEFAHHLIDLLDNREWRQNLGEAGRRYVTQENSWQYVTGILEQIYQSLINPLDFYQNHEIR